MSVHETESALSEQQSDNNRTSESQSPPSLGVHSVNSTESMTSLESPLMIPLDKLSFLDLLDSSTLTTQLTKKFSSTVKRGTQLKNKVSKLSKDADLDKLREQLVRQVDKLDKRLSQENIITTTEKLTFSFWLINIFYSGFIIGAAPQYFHLLYTTELCILWPLRVYTYRKRGFQYYLVDLCYFVNFLVLLYIWVFPSSVKLFISCYSLCFGTLCWAVITWRNSLVLHSIEKSTSTFIHVLPPVVMHVITHRIDDSFKLQRFPAVLKLVKWDFFEGLLWASAAYVIWQSAYHYFITLKRKDKIKAGRVTSFEYLRKAYAKHPLGKFVNGLPEPYPIVAFTFIQYGYQLCTMILCPLWYSSELLSSFFLTFIFGWASYNGGSYYVEYFGKRFQKELIKLQNTVAEFESENSVSVYSPSGEPLERKTTSNSNSNSVEVDQNGQSVRARASGQDKTDEKTHVRDASFYLDN